MRLLSIFRHILVKRSSCSSVKGCLCLLFIRIIWWCNWTSSFFVILICLNCLRNVLLVPWDYLLLHCLVLIEFLLCFHLLKLEFILERRFRIRVNSIETFNCFLKLIINHAINRLGKLMIGFIPLKRRIRPSVRNIFIRNLSATFTLDHKHIVFQFLASEVRIIQVGAFLSSLF